MRLLLFLLSISSLSAINRLPDEFTVVERFLALTDTFDVSTDLGPFAIARKRLFSLSTSFDLEDDLGRPLASAKARFFEWGTVADVWDPDGLNIGKIEEVVWRILPWAEYKVYDAQDRLAAIAKMNIWGTHFDLFHPDQPEHIYASIERPFIRVFRDYWTVQVRDYAIFEEKTIDPRLLVMLAVFQTDKDNRDRLRNEILDQLRREQYEYEGARVN